MHGCRTRQKQMKFILRICNELPHYKYFSLVQNNLETIWFKFQFKYVWILFSLIFSHFGFLTGFLFLKKNVSSNANLWINFVNIFNTFNLYSHNQMRLYKEIVKIKNETSINIALNSYNLSYGYSWILLMPRVQFSLDFSLSCSF